MVCVLAFLIIPATAMWSGTLKVNVVVSVRVADLDIGSWRVFLNYTCGECRGIRGDYVSLSDDYDVITIYLDEETENVWVGLVIENDHATPLELTGFEVVFNPSGIQPDYLVYPYEPIKKGVGTMPYWGQLNCEDLPVTDYLTTLPVQIDGGWKDVAWLNVTTSGMVNGYLTIRLLWTHPS